MVRPYFSNVEFSKVEIVVVLLHETKLYILFLLLDVFPTCNFALSSELTLYSPVSQDQTATVLFFRRRCVVLKFQDQRTTK